MDFSVPFQRQNFDIAKKNGPVNIALAGRQALLNLTSIDCIFLRNMVQHAPPSVDEDNPVTFDATLHEASMTITD